MVQFTPQRFGPYTILGRIGGGGMAEIFLAKASGLSGFEKLLALKRILPKYSDKPAFVQLLTQEAKLAARLQHHNVVQVYDLGEVEGQVYIAMEYIRGLDLAAILSKSHKRKERMPLPLSLWIITEFLSGLDYAHRLCRSDGSSFGMIHRDISPQNVLLSFEGEVKVTDFGIARVVSTPDLLLPGQLHGKYGYMSPEQIEQAPIDQRADIFSAGVVIWELLCGTRLFRAKTPAQTSQRVCEAPIPPPSSLNPEVPPELDAICARALARDVRDRYQTVGALIGDLSRVANSLPTRAVSRDLAVYLQSRFKPAQRPRTPPPSEARDRIGPASLGQLLMDRAGLSPSGLDLALAAQRARGGRLGDLLIESGLIDHGQLAESLAAQAGCQLLDGAELRSATPDPELLRRFPRDAALNLQILPLAQDAEGVDLALSDPFNKGGLAEAKLLLGAEQLRLWIVDTATLQEALARWYPAPAPMRPPPATESVLIADADPAVRAPIRERLELEGYRVLSTGNGVEALRLYHLYRPPLLLLDLALPGVDGLNLLLDVRAEVEDEATVFLMSSRDDEALAAKAHELGADAFVRKPVRLEALLAKLRRELKRHARRHPAAEQGSGSLTETQQDPRSYRRGPEPARPLPLPAPRKMREPTSSVG